MPRGTTVNYFSENANKLFRLKVRVKLEARNEENLEARAELEAKYESLDRLFQEMLDREVKANPALAQYRGTRHE